jgi:hypothetical protein
VQIKNNSDRSIGRVGLRIMAYEPARSTNLVSYADPGIASDAIIGPGQTATLCVALPEFQEIAAGKFVAEFVYRVEIQSAEHTDLVARSTPRAAIPLSSKEPSGSEDRTSKRAEDMTDEELLDALGLMTEKSQPAPVSEPAGAFDGSDIFPGVRP